MKQDRKKVQILTVNPQISQCVLCCPQLSLNINLTLIIYNYLQIPSLEQFLQQALDFQGQLYLTRRAKKYVQSGQHEYYLLYMINQNSEDGKEDWFKFYLKVLVGLCDKIVVFDVNNQTQGYVEKVFFQAFNAAQTINWNFYHHFHRLVLVKSCYSNKYFPNKEANKSSNKTYHNNTLKYFGNMKLYKQQIQNEINKIYPIMNKILLSNANKYVDQLFVQKSLIKMISLKQIIQIYEGLLKLRINSYDMSPSFKQINQNCQQISIDEPWKVRYNLQKIYELQTIRKIYTQLQHQIFNISSPQILIKTKHHQIHRYLSLQKSSSILQQHNVCQNLNEIILKSKQIQIELPQNLRKKLIWKIKRLQKYQRQVGEDQKISSSYCQNKLIYELTEGEVAFWLQKYYKKWLCNTFSHLKSHFNKIANQNDIKSISQFRSQCCQLSHHLNLLNLGNFPPLHKNKLTYISSQLQFFTKYHLDIIDSNSFSGFKYFVKDLRYLIKYQEKFRNKLIVFLLVMAFATMQADVITAITVATFAFIVLAIRF